jgi:multiple sugar transport system ATP-binding protein
VAEFIGSPAMNFVEGEHVEEEGKRGLRTPDAFIELTDNQWNAAVNTPSDRIVAGVRPEHLVPVAPADEGYAATFQGTVDIVESLGSEQHVFVSLANGSLVARAAASLPMASGQSITLGVRPEHLHLFDQDSGERIGA